MGKGDKKSTKGKIWRGSYGNTRPKGKSQSKTASIAIKIKCPASTRDFFMRAKL